MIKLYAPIHKKQERYSRLEKIRSGKIYRLQNMCWPNNRARVVDIVESELVLSPAVEKKGSDKWGDYFNFTGHEEPGHCFWCGKDTGHWRYCKGHRQLYLGNYSWGTAQLLCKRKHRINGSRGPWIYFCDDCGYEGHYDDYQVHHIRPMMGHTRTWHWLNHQDNLTYLCHECHNRTHVSLNKRWLQLGKVDYQRGEQLKLL